MLDDTITTPAWAMRLKADIDFKGWTWRPLQAGDWVIVDPNADFVSASPTWCAWPAASGRSAAWPRQTKRLSAAVPGA